MKRDPHSYQIMVEGQPVMVADATREQIEQELMRAMDVMQSVEERLQPLSRTVSGYVSGHTRRVDEALPADGYGS